MEKANLREKEVCEYISVTRAVLNTWRREGKFPNPIRLGTKAIGWKRQDIDNWIESRPSA